jgi:predicted PurR-regulated permease PerM
MFSQLSQFSESWPLLVEKFTLILNQGISSAAAYFDVNPEYIHEWIKKTQGELLNISSSAIGQTLVALGSGLAAVLLVPVYIFLILFYQPLLLEFIRRLFNDSYQNQVNKIVTQTKTVIQRYLFGLVIEAVIVGTLDATALLLLGVQYAILLGIIGALLNITPYIGGIVAVALPMMIALATKSSAWYAVYVLIILYIM